MKEEKKKVNHLIRRGNKENHVRRSISQDKISNLEESPGFKASSIPERMMDDPPDRAKIEAKAKASCDSKG